eukprot:CAMPEP_0170373462 /NCGR_PEP_ID=MMETSP0117_2-20130122/10082_1 /TAXON_ID=400756 /ORGANISM="Durinskia baltica, Strain CSIRO CS-38" /LENGTH=255 /DNA_ID=CAMNT_0010628355 /DNA_START=76 /DNA_END=843 /DNA_ORIENTATION=+
MNRDNSLRMQGFAVGVALATAIFSALCFIRTNKIDNHDAADDDCQSLFYDLLPEDCKGKGFTSLRTTSTATIALLKKVHPEYSRLPFELYKQVVESLPIVCVDVICRRNDGKILLFYRRDKPAASIWWWPGGRMFRGETFYDAAIRKARDETGNKTLRVNPRGLVTVWNTFFPDSHWDAERMVGKEGTQTVNVVVVCDVSLDSECEVAEVETLGTVAEWAVEAQRWISPSEALVVGKYDKYVSSNVKLAIEKGLL